MPSTAADMTNQPNPELLKRFEAEKANAQADKKAAEELIKAGQNKVREAQQMRDAAAAKTNRELCKLGILPPNLCP